MAVVLLSKTTRVKSWLLKTALINPGIPEWKKVESPMTAFRMRADAPMMQRRPTTACGPMRAPASS